MKRKIEVLENLYLKYKQVINYLFFGGLTTIVNLITYYLSSKVFGLEEILSSGISWFVAVLFAYVTNKFFVFDSQKTDFKNSFKELLSFFGCRVFSGVVCEIGVFALLIKVFKLNDLIAKFLTQIIVIILNFILSKFVVFSKKDKSSSVKEFVKKHKKSLIIVGVTIALLAITFVIMMMSPLNLWKNGEAGTDSSVFKTVAYVMKNGGMPYRDTFDHKGPIIYILNLIGMHLTYYRGIWIVEFISMFVTVVFMYKIARLNCNKIFSIIVVLISSTMLFTYFEGGNLVEEYAMPFIAMSIYIFLDYFLNKKITKLRLILCGLGCGVITLLRPNMISVWAVFSLAVLVYNIKIKNTKEIGKFILYFLIGFAIPVLPTIIWLIVNNSFTDFIEDYILFNMSYSQAGEGKSIFFSRIESFLHFLNETIMVFAVLSNLYFLYSKKEKFLNATYIIYLLVTLLFICVSGRSYGHYGMILVPAVVYPISQLFKLAENGIKKDKEGPTAILVIYLFVSLIIPKWTTMLNNINVTYEDRDKIDNKSSYKVVSDYIINNTDEEDKITVAGNWNIIYVMTKRLPASKYSYQFPIGIINPDIMEEYIEDLEREKPKVIVVNSGMTDLMQNFIEKYNYEAVLTYNSIKVYEIKTDSV